jgi:putative addiction module component (TIGR02574 family)
MSTDPADVVDVALSLTEEERAELAYTLIQSLKPPRVLSDVDPEFEEDLERRVQAYEAGETSAEDWNTVSDRLRESLKSRKS